MAVRRVLPLVFAFSLMAVLIPTVASASAVHLAQESVENENAEGGEESAGEGQSDPDAESGANEGQTEEATSTEEEGPPWTYQMARMSLGLIVLLMAGVAFLYYKLVASRQKGAI